MVSMGVRWNLGKPLSIREVVQQLSDLLPCTVDPQFGALPDRPLERVKKANIAESHKLIGWQPSTPLQAGLTRTIEWYKKQAELIR
jgi:UDP-glucose 4-epimerase